VVREGVVDQMELREAAERCASEVAGVRAIDNPIRLRRGAEEE
jgi:osmotically-inducible protein OsmY